jgi:hypothetical protein
MVSNTHNLNPYQNFVELNRLLFLTDEKNKHFVDCQQKSQNIFPIFIFQMGKRFYKLRFKYWRLKIEMGARSYSH